MNNLDKLPDVAYHKNTVHCNGPSGEPPLILLRKGQPGYWPIYNSWTAEQINESIGVTPQQASAMFHGSVFGWDTPVADPDDPINQPKVKDENA